MKKLLLINPVNPRSVGLSSDESSRFPPLGLGVVASLTPDNFRIRLIDENIEKFKYEDADLVALSAFTSSAPRAYEIAAMYRNRGIPVVMGGIHSSMCPEEAGKYVDAVVTGEAESTWPQVIEDFNTGGLKDIYRGELIDLKEMPVPDRSLFSPEYEFATIQTSRGCPMDCSFCSVTPFNGRRYRRRDVADVLNELEGIPEKLLFFVDDNIIGYSQSSREQAISLFKGMVERNMDKRWFCQASLNFGENDEVLKWAHRAGCRMVFLGLESADPAELREINKKLNLKVEYHEILDRIHRHGISVLGAFVNGLDSETVDSLKRKARFILRNPIDVIQTTLLTPLPGTRLFDQYKHEDRLLLTDFPGDWEKYDMTHLAFRPKSMDPGDFLKAYRKTNSLYYSRWTLLRLFLRTWRTTGSLEAACWSLASNKSYRRVFKGLEPLPA